MQRRASSRAVILGVILVGVVIALVILFAATNPTTKTVTTTTTTTATSYSIATEEASTVTVTVTVTATTNSSSLPGGAYPIVESGTLTVPSGAGEGTLVVTVKNSAGSPITGISITDTAGLSLNSGTVAASGAVTAWTFSGPGAGDQIPEGGVSVGSTTSGAAQVCDGTANGCPATDLDSSSSLTAGTTYSFTVTLTFANGGTNVQVLSMTAQV